MIPNTNTIIVQTAAFFLNVKAADTKTSAVVRKPLGLKSL
jgi:hypothetical protein